MAPKAGEVEAQQPVVPNAPASGVDVSEGASDKAKVPTGAALNGAEADQADALLVAPKVEVQGTIHTEFSDKVLKIDEPTAKADMEALTGKTSAAFTIEDIRYNSRLLHQKDATEDPAKVVENLKDETARRMKAYTKDNGDGWFELHYDALGSDKNGLTHELYVGLGDILLDVEIQNILVIVDGKETPIKAHRGIVPDGKHHSGRVAFLDENNEYLATHTNDKFRIVSSDKIDPAAYSEKLKVEDGAREKGRPVFRSTTVDLAMAENDVTMKDNISLKADYNDENGKPASVEITNDVINKAAAECATTATVEKAAQRENLMKILNYISAKVDVPVYAMMAIIFMESTIQFPAAVGDEGAAHGMGQFHLGAMKEVKKESIFHELVGEVMQENPGSAGRNKNIFVDLVAVAVLLKQQSARFGFRVSKSTPSNELLEDIVRSPDGIGLTRLSWVRMGYHVPGHAAIYTKLLKSGNVDSLEGSDAKNYPIARKWLLDHKDKYVEFSEHASAAHSAIQRQEALA
jgi:hypothetical protein